MNVFWHINDLKSQSIPLLGPLALFANEINVWSPSHTTFAAAQENGLSRLSPLDFVELVADGHFRVCARKDWIINGDRRRASSEEIPEARWLEDFDGRLLRIFADDERLPPNQRRVTSHPREVGQDGAKALSKSRGDLLELAKNMIETGNIPEGAKQHLINTFEKNDFLEIQNGVTDEHAEQIFRMAINHFEAMNLSNSDISIDLDPLQSQRYSLFAQAPHVETQDRGEFSLGKLREAMDIARSLSGHETSEQIAELRKSRREREFFWQLVSSEISAIQELKLQISYGKEASEISLVEEVYGKDLENQIMGGAGLALASGSLLHCMTRRKFVSGAGALFTAGLALSVGPATKPILEQASLIGEGDYQGPRWPSVFMLGKSNPNRAEIAEIHDRIVQLAVEN